MNDRNQRLLNELHRKSQSISPRGRGRSPFFGYAQHSSEDALYACMHVQSTSYRFVR